MDELTTTSYGSAHTQPPHLARPWRGGGRRRHGTHRHHPHSPSHHHHHTRPLSSPGSASPSSGVTPRTASTATSTESRHGGSSPHRPHHHHTHHTSPHTRRYHVDQLLHASAPAALSPQSPPRRTFHDGVALSDGLPRRSVSNAAVHSVVPESASDAVRALETHHTVTQQQLEGVYRLYRRLRAHNASLEENFCTLRAALKQVRTRVVQQVCTRVRTARTDMHALRDFAHLLFDDFADHMRHTEHLLLAVLAESTHDTARRNTINCITPPIRYATPLHDPLTASSQPWHRSLSLTPHPTEPDGVATSYSVGDKDDRWNVSGLAPTASSRSITPRRIPSPSALWQHTGSDVTKSDLATESPRALQLRLAATQKQVLLLSRRVAQQEQHWRARLARLREVHVAREVGLEEKVRLLGVELAHASRLTIDRDDPDVGAGQAAATSRQRDAATRRRRGTESSAVTTTRAAQAAWARQVLAARGMATSSTTESSRRME